MGPVGARRLVVVDKPLNPKTLSIRPLNPVIGAEIEGVDLSRPLADEQFAEVRAALNAHHVLIFRDQTLNREDHKRFGRMFGRLHVHPYHAKKVAPEHAANRGGVGDDPEILVVRADQNSKFVAGEGWHTDVTCDAEPPMGSMLYVTETPPNGAGDTCFASTIRAYDALSTTMQGFIEGLTATHDGAQALLGGYGAPEPPGGWPRSTHPVVIRHPENGKQGAVREPRLHDQDQRARRPRERRACSSCSGATSRAGSTSSAASTGRPTRWCSGTTAAPSTTRSGTTIPTPATASASRSSASARRSDRRGQRLVDATGIEPVTPSV